MLSDDQITAIGNRIDAIPPKARSARELDLLLTKLDGKIRSAQERGATYAEIAKEITEQGYPLKTSTLRLAMQRRNKKGRRPRRRKAARAPSLKPAA